MSTSRRSTTTAAGVVPADAPADVPEWTVEMHELTREACWELLAGGSELVGRIGLVAEDGPLILPVNFAVVDRSIVIRTAFGTLIDTTPTLERVSFEVDHTDPERMTAWSVLVLGRAWELKRPDALIAGVSANLHSWAPGSRDRWVRIAASATTGRMIRRHRTPHGEPLPYMPPD